MGAISIALLAGGRREEGGKKWRKILLFTGMLLAAKTREIVGLLLDP